MRFISASPGWIDGRPCSTLSRETRAYTSSEPCDGADSILFAASGYAAFNFARCTSACHCKYGYSCISLAHTGVFSSSPPAMEMTSWPFGTRCVPTTRGTVTRSALRRFALLSSAPHDGHVGAVILRDALFASRRISSSDAPRSCAARDPSLSLRMTSGGVGDDAIDAGDSLPQCGQT